MRRARTQPERRQTRDGASGTSTTGRSCRGAPTPAGPTDAGVDRVLVEPPCLSPFVEEDASATFAGGRKLEDGDRLLCFGRLEEMRDLIPKRKKRRTRVRKLPKVPIHES